MAYTSKSGKTYANPAYGKMMDDAEQAEARKPMADKAEAKDDAATPIIKIVIAQAPDGSFTSDDGKDADSHADLASLIDHIKGRFGGADEPAEDEQDAAAQAAPSASPDITDSVAAMLQPRK